MYMYNIRVSFCRLRVQYDNLLSHYVYLILVNSKYSYDSYQSNL